MSSSAICCQQRFAFAPFVEEHLYVNDPWKYQLSQLYYEPVVIATVQQMAQENDLATAV
jgi:hypothetical protein